MVFDAHSDIWTDVTTRRLNGETDVLRKYHLARLRKGGVEGCVFVIWIDPPFDADPMPRTKDIIECANAEIAECDEIQIVHTYDEMIKAYEDGKIYIWNGVEGMAAIGEDLSLIDTMYYEFGCRQAMLTWNEVNALGAGANSGDASGLTELGKKAARHIQDKNMLLDTSHLNEAGFWDIVDLATKPIAATHSNCRALCDVPRNLTDDQLRAIRDLDGVVGLNSFIDFIDPDPENQNVEHLARHADHMINIMGIDHVGCGFDFCDFVSAEAMGSMTESASAAPADMKDASEVPNLFACFKKLGLTDDEMDKIARRNFQNLFKKAVG